MILLVNKQMLNPTWPPWQVNHTISKVLPLGVNIMYMRYSSVSTYIAFYSKDSLGKNLVEGPDSNLAFLTYILDKITS